MFKKRCEGVEGICEGVEGICVGAAGVSQPLADPPAREHKPCRSFLHGDGAQAWGSGKPPLPDAARFGLWTQTRPHLLGRNDASANVSSCTLMPTAPRAAAFALVARK